MAKKQIKNTAQQTIKKNKKSQIQLAIILLIGVAVIGYFFYDNIFKDKESKLEYYTFTKEGELTFTDSLGTLKAKIDIEIADNDYERQLGLMNRNKMDANQGMLFIFPRQDYLSFWMRNTLIPLDMIFVNDKKKIVTIHKNTKTLSDQSYPASEPAQYVVEVVGGFTDKHNIKVGDKIDWIGTKIGL